MDANQLAVLGYQGDTLVGTLVKRDGCHSPGIQSLPCAHLFNVATAIYQSVASIIR